MPIHAAKLKTKNINSFPTTSEFTAHNFSSKFLE